MFKYTKSDRIGEEIQKSDLLTNNKSLGNDFLFKLETLDDLLKRDEQREKDGFKKKIKISKFVSPGKKQGKDSIIIVPTTQEEKLYHSPFNPQQDEETGGEGSEGEEGDVIGEQPIDDSSEEGEEGDGQAGEGSGGEHGLSKEIYETGKILTEQFDLPNIKDKGKKVAIPQYKYDLTDTNDKSGQLLDKNKTLNAICKTNIMLGNLSKDKKDTKDLVVRPDDKIYRVLSRERMYESQAIVFFCRDYSGSMYGNPTECVVKQHLMIYSWLVYQYSNRVIPRFILHDTEAKEANDFSEYYRSVVAGGTKIASAYSLINTIVEDESLEKDYNIFVIYGSDGDNWMDENNETTEELKKMIMYANRVGISIAKNSYVRGKTRLEEQIERSGFITNRKILRMDTFDAKSADDQRLINGIKYLMGDV